MAGEDCSMMYAEVIEWGAEAFATADRLRTETTDLRARVSAVMLRYCRHRFREVSGASDICEPQELPERSDAAIADLLSALRYTRTDLAKLVKRVLLRHPSSIAVSPDAIARWQKDAPGAWESVREWLIARGVRVVQDESATREVV